nr:hypothetical protein [Tanacetum cinerariifolium]
QVPSFQTLPSFPQQDLVVKIMGVFLKPTIVNTLTPMYEMFGQFTQKKHEEEQAANARYWKIPACCDDDDDYNFVITPNEPVDSLSMGDEHLNTITATESDEFIKSSVENLVPNPSESEGKMVMIEDQSLYDEDVPEKIFSNPLFEEEIIPMKIDQHHDNAESDLIESLLNQDSSIIPSSSKIDSLLDEFAMNSLFSNQFHRELMKLIDSDSLMEEIDLSFTLDDPMPSGIKEDEDDSERDILILEELVDNYFLSLPENESFHFEIPSFSRPPAKAPDGNTGILNIKMMGNNSEQKVPIPGLTIIRVSNQEKSPDLLSHQGLEIF